MLVGGRVLARTWPPFICGAVTVDVAVRLARAISDTFGVPTWVAQGAAA
jgi:hypothetical protein